MKDSSSPCPRPTLTGLLLLALPSSLLVWAYWPTFRELAQLWAHDPQYSHGYLVPLFSLYLLWQRRQMLPVDSFQLSAWGLPLLVLGTAFRLLGSFFFLPALEIISLLPCLAGLCLLFAGPRSLRWAWPALAFLLFMIPLPYRVEVALAQPLQTIATQASAYLLQTLGFPALAEGNVILLNDIRIGVVEACNGLSMLLTFFALSAAVAIVIRGHPLHRILLVLSAVPIALLANIIRILVTAILHDQVGERIANLVFHDLAGWLMMPLALVLMGVELWALRRIFVETAPARGSTLPATSLASEALGSAWAGRRQAPISVPKG